MKNKGLIYVFEGDGKGKTSAALGVTVRMLLSGKKVVWISWYKSLSWQMSEAGLPEKFGSSLKMYFAGEGFYIKDGEKIRSQSGTIKKATVGKATVYDQVTMEVHELAARNALTLVEDVMAGIDPPALIVMDEVIKAVNDGLISEERVCRVLQGRGKTHVVLTGHSAPKSIVLLADLVTNMKKVKHPYDQGVLAVKGLDY